MSHRPSYYRKRHRFYIVYGGVLLALAAIQVASKSLWGQLMWIDRRNHPGGPLGFYLASQRAWYVIIGVVATAMANSIGDGLLVRPISLKGGSNGRADTMAELDRCIDAS
jgi:hypothetical protein